MQQDGVAVRRRFRDDVRAEIAAGTWAIVDDDRLLENLAHLVGDDLAEDADAAAWRIGHDHADRPVRIALRLRAHRSGADRKHRAEHQSKSSHYVFPGPSRL